MKNISIILILFLCISNCTNTESYEYYDTFSIMTFNVRHRDEATFNISERDKYTWSQRSPELINIINNENPDILVLQELNDQSWFGTKPEHDSVQSLFINELHNNNEYDVYINSLDPFLFTNNCDNISADNVMTKTPKAIFFKRTKFKCLISGSAKLIGEINKEGKQISRYASWVILQSLQSNSSYYEKYFVLNVHLAAGNNEPVRIESVNQLIPLVKKYSKYGNCQLPIILAGDFNSLPNSEPINLINENLGLQDAHQFFSEPTVNSWKKMTVRLDFILHSKDLNVNSAKTIYFQKLAASDHLPLKATIISNNINTCN